MAAVWPVLWAPGVLALILFDAAGCGFQAQHPPSGGDGAVGTST